MSTDWDVIGVRQYWPAPDAAGWMVTLQRDDGLQAAHVIPDGTLLNRAVEYGLDPDDFDALLDLVLHEPHLPDPADPVSLPPDGIDPAHTAGLTTTARVSLGYVREGDPVAVTLSSAETVGQAREAMQARLAWTKEHRARINFGGPVISARGAGPVSAVQAMRDAHRPDPEDLARRRAAAARVFACHRHEGGTDA